MNGSTMFARRLLVSLLSTSPLKRPGNVCLFSYRFQSNLKNIENNRHRESSFHDAKLREIIETSNLGKGQNLSPEPVATVSEGFQYKADVSDSPQIDKAKAAEKACEGHTKHNNEGAYLTQRLVEDFHAKLEKIPGKTEQKRKEWVKKIEEGMNSFQDVLSLGSKMLNDLTGYSIMESLKASIHDLEKILKEKKEQVRVCKDTYSQAIARRSQLQKEMNELLTRKHNWSPMDLERFTELYRNDHKYEQEEVNSLQRLNEAEQEVDAIQLRLTQEILSRYHEEQIWSDKIRRASTWGTWAIMIANLFLFVIATFLVEPWKRRRLVASFEERVKELLAEKEISIPEKKKEESINLFPAEPSSLSVSPFSNSNSSPLSSSTYQLAFSGASSWAGLKCLALQSYDAFTSDKISKLEISKSDFYVVAALTSIVSLSIGTFLTSLIVK